ncbi:MAG: lysophospholipid acyltransferase family protein [Spartobacteria bacterium]
MVFLNHAAWWDPLVCLFLARKVFPGRAAYGPMDAAALERYGFFRRLGFFAVETETTRGAAQFLRTSSAILERPESALFLTPQGKFADVRAPLILAPGIEHLAARAPQARFVPLAIEYAFWEERKPEVLLAFGAGEMPDAATSLTERLAATQAGLATAVQRRQPNEWEMLLRTRSGVSRPYDLWRWARARLRGEAFRADHAPL